MNFGAMISKHRRAVMGLAAIILIGFHSYWRPDFLPWKALINVYGNAGVDFFVFVSGFGLAFALEKKPDYAHFYARRLERVLPSYYVVVTIKMISFLIVGKLSLDWIIKSYIPIGVWGKATAQFWYVSATLGYYMMAPLFFRLFKRARFPRITLIVTLIVTGILVPIICKLDSKPIMRIPAFITGIAMGVFQTDHTSKKDRWLDFSILAACFVLSVLIMMDSFLLDLPFFNLIKKGHPTRLWKDLSAPFAVVVIAYCFEWMEKTPLRFLNRVFDRFGRYSLEVYMSHLMIKTFAYSLFDMSRLGSLIVMLLLTYPVSVGVSKAGNGLLALLKKLPLTKPAEP